MKKITSRILLFVYISGLLAPVSPIITDVLAHTFWRAQHLATVHCVNGKYHVHYEMYKSANQSGDSKKNSLLNADEVISMHIQSNGAGIDFTFCSEPFYLKDKIDVDNPIIKISSPPPRVA